MCILCWNDKNNEKKWFKFESEEAALKYVSMYKINDYFITYEDYKLERLEKEIDRLKDVLHSIDVIINGCIKV